MIEIPKIIEQKIPSIDSEDLLGDEAFLKVKPGYIKLDYGGENKLKDLLTSHLNIIVILGLVAILLSCWFLGYSFYGYSSTKKTIMYVVDNNLDPNAEYEKRGYDKVWAGLYKRIKEEKGKELAERVLKSHIKDHYFMFSSPIATVLFYSVLILFGIGMLLWPVNTLYTVMKFDRLSGKVTLKRYLGLKTYTADFHNDKSFRFRLVSSTFKHGTQMSLAICFPESNYQFDTGIPYFDEYVSFLTHYMDKNRPLPDGTAFDPYREADYERRKAEGFPSPLYTALFSMTDYDGVKRYKY